MKIAIVHPSEGCDAITSSAPAILIHQYSKLAPSADEICVFSGWTKTPFSDISTHLLPKDTPPYAKNEVPLLVEQMKKFNPDIVEVHLQLKWAVGLAKALPEIPVVYYRHNPSETPIWIKLLGRSLRYCYLAGIISVSQFCHNRLITLHPEHKNRHHKITNALPSADWQSDINQKEKIIFFSGRPIAEKGIGELADALLSVLPDFPDWKFVCLAAMPITEENIGFGNMDSQSKTLLAKLKSLSAQFLWLTNSERATIQEWVKKASIALVPANYDENFPLVAIESHLAGCALISSGRGGLTEISGTDGALYLDEVSPKAIEKALRYLMENKNEREALAQRGYAYIMEHHKIENRVAELDALRKKIIAETKPSPQSQRFGALKAKLRQLF